MRTIARTYLPIAALLALVALGLTARITRPWVGLQSYASASVAIVGRNHATYGLGVTRGASIEVVDRKAPASSHINVRHPFYYRVLVGLSDKLFGVSERSSRLVEATFSLGCVLMLWLLVSQVYGRIAGWFAAAFFGLAPLNLYYGQVLTAQPAVTCFAIAAVYAYVCWLRSGSGRSYAMIVVCMALAMMMDWPGFYLSGLLPLHYFLFARSRRQPIRALALGAVGPIVFGLFLLHIALVWPEALENLRTAFLQRTTQVSIETLPSDTAVYGLRDYVLRIEHNVYELMLAPTVMLAGGGLIWLLVKGFRRQGESLQTTLPLLLAGLGVCHTVLFFDTMFWHPFMLVLFLPAMATLAGAAMGQLFIAEPRRGLPVCLAVFAFAMFSVDAVRNTRGLYAQEDWLPVQIGRELHEATRADDEIIVVGMRDHAAVEWYADRNVRFPLRKATVQNIVQDGRINIVAMLKVEHKSFTDLASRDDEVAKRFVARSAEWMAYVNEHAKPLGQTEQLRLYELTAAPPPDTAPPPAAQP